MGGERGLTNDRKLRVVIHGRLLIRYLLVQWVTTKMGGFLKLTIGTTPAESMNAAANIFLGPAGNKNLNRFKLYNII